MLFLWWFTTKRNSLLQSRFLCTEEKGWYGSRMRTFRFEKWFACVRSFRNVKAPERTVLNRLQYRLTSISSVHQASFAWHNNNNTDGPSGRYIWFPHIENPRLRKSRGYGTIVMKGKRQAHEDTRRSDANYDSDSWYASNFMTSCRWSWVTSVREAL